MKVGAINEEHKTSETKSYLIVEDSRWQLSQTFVNMVSYAEGQEIRLI